MPVFSFLVVYGVKWLRWCQYVLVCCLSSTMLLLGWCVSVWPREDISVKCVKEVVMLPRFKLFFSAKSAGKLLDLFSRYLLVCFEQSCRVFGNAKLGSVVVFMA